MTATAAALRAAIDLIQIPIALLDLDGRIEHINPANERLLGQTAEALRGKLIGTVFAARRRKQARDMLASLLEQGKSTWIFEIVRPDGTTQPVEVTASLVRAADGTPNGILATARDLGPELDRFARLNGSATKLLTAPGDDLLVTIVRVARDLLGARYAALGVVENGRLVRFIPDGMSDAQIAGIEHWPDGHGLLGAMIAERRTIRIEEMATDSRSSGFPSGHPPMLSFLGTPIQVADEVYGHLYFTEKLGATEFSFVDGHLVELFASHAALAIRDGRRRESLQSNERVLAEAQRIAHIGSWERDVATGVLRWSDESHRIMGIAPGTFPGTIEAFLAFVHPDDRTRAAPSPADLAARDPAPVEYRIIRPDGTVRHLYEEAAVIRDPTGAPIRYVGVTRDITEQVAADEERRRLEAVLRQSEHNLAEAQRISHIGSWEFDFATRTALRSEETERILGVEPGTLPATLEAFLALVHPDERRRVRQFEQAATSEGGRHGLDYRIIRPDGVVRLVREEVETIHDPSGNPVGLVGTVQDVTERVELEAQQARSARLLDELRSEIYVFNAETLRFTEANAGAVRNLGYSFDELSELTPLDVKPELTAASFAALIAPLRDGRRDQVAFETIHRRKDGSTYPVEVRIHFLASEVPPAFVAVVQDITERVAADAERNRLVSAIEQTADSIWIQDLEGIITYVNQAFSRTYGYEPGEIVGHHAGIIDSGHHPPAFFDQILASVKAGRTWTGSVINRRKNGSVFEVDAVISAILDPHGRSTGYMQTDRDITHERALESALARMARERDVIEAALARIDPADSPEAIAAAACAEIVRLAETDSSIAIRLGADRGQILAAAGRLSAVISTGDWIPPARARYLLERASVGPWIETWKERPGDGGFGEAISSSDLYAAAYAPLRGVRGGVLGVVCFGAHDPASAEQLVERLPSLATFGSIIAALVAPGLEARHGEDHARSSVQVILDAAAFRPFFQPIADLHTGAVVGYEALSRFTDGTLPDVVFALAGRAGLGIELEIATLGAALEAATALPSTAYLSVNASPAFIGSGELGLLLAGLDRQIVLEITEHVVVDNYVALRRDINALGAGVRLAVDDAGAGYASLRHILELAPDFVKLDIGLIRGINSDPARQALIAGMTYFAVKRKVHLIAEGIETAAELETLRSLAIPFGQGYLLGHPQDGRGAGPWPTRTGLSTKGGGGS